MIYDVRHNRMRDARMRDGRRWVKVYRERAWETALRESRQRSFFSSVLFIMSQFVLLAGERKRS